MSEGSDLVGSDAVEDVSIPVDVSAPDELGTVGEVYRNEEVKVSTVGSTSYTVVSELCDR